MKKLLKSLMAVALIFALVVPTAFAVDGEEPVKESVHAKITKELKVEENVLVPTAEFKFTVSPKTPDEGEQYGDALVQEGIEDLLMGGELAYPLAEGLEAELELTLGELEEVTPGVYKYVVKETKGEVDGMVYDETTYDLYLLVTLDENGNKVANYFVPGKDDDTKGNLAFTNTYNTSNLTVEKEIKGNTADMSKTFEFTITVTGVEGEKYATNMKDVVLESGKPQNVTLGNGESIVIYGLSENDTYTVVENNPGEYTATGEVKEALAMGKDDKTVTVINTLDTTIPTGVIETVAPFALMIVAALGFAVVYFRKRNIEA